MSQGSATDHGSSAAERVSRRASLVQDLWVGIESRQRGRRLAPFDEPEARIVFVPSLGASLDEPSLASFLETLADRAEVIAYEPFSGLDGTLEGQRLSLLDRMGGFRRFWPSHRPEFVVGHGLGGSLALSVASEAGIRGVAALSPWLPSVEASREAFEALFPACRLEEVSHFLRGLDLEGRSRSTNGELLFVAGREDPLVSVESLQVVAAQNPRAVLALIPGGVSAPLQPPWGRVVAVWASEVARPQLADK
jgi:pimeloyl-ACP methyl ester carboxylesterase